MLKFQIQNPDGTTFELSGPNVKIEKPEDWIEWGQNATTFAFKMLHGRLSTFSPITDLATQLSDSDMDRLLSECFWAGSKFANSCFEMKHLVHQQADLASALIREAKANAEAKSDAPAVESSEIAAAERSSDQPAATATDPDFDPVALGI